MSEENKPTRRPSQTQSPPPPSGQKPAGRPQGEQVQAVLGQAKTMFDRLGIDTDTGVKTLLLAVAFGVIGGILDKIFEFPTGSFYLVFGIWAAVLNGFTYVFFQGRESLAAVVMAAVNGFVALLLWWIVTKIVGDRTVVAGFKYNPADEYSILEVLLTGVVAGLLGFGWYVGLGRLRGFKILRG